MAASTKDVLKILAFLVVFYIAAPYLLGGILWLFSKPRVIVRYETAVSSRVNNVEILKQYRLYSLDGDLRTSYDFNSFMPATGMPGGLSQEEKNTLGLGLYLKEGDYISKMAQSTNLTVRRGSDVTQWSCPAGPIAE